MCENFDSHCKHTHKKRLTFQKAGIALMAIWYFQFIEWMFIRAHVFHDIVNEDTYQHSELNWFGRFFFVSSNTSQFISQLISTNWNHFKVIWLCTVYNHFQFPLHIAPSISQTHRIHHFLYCYLNFWNLHLYGGCTLYNSTSSSKPHINSTIAIIIINSSSNKVFAFQTKFSCTKCITIVCMCVVCVIVMLLFTL